jgi:hypothetical protein
MPKAKICAGPPPLQPDQATGATSTTTGSGAITKVTGQRIERFAKC